MKHRDPSFQPLSIRHRQHTRRVTLHARTSTLPESACIPPKVTPRGQFTSTPISYLEYNMTSPSPSSSFVVPPSESSAESGDGSNSPVVVYRPPTVISLVRTAAINLVLPFINGLMLGFGELFAHELAFRWGWGGTRVFPRHRATRAVGPGIEVRERKRTRDDRSGGLDKSRVEMSSPPAPSPFF